MTVWISTKEAMRMLGVGSTTIKRWADENRLPYIRTAGGHRRFDRSVVSRMLRELENSGEAAESVDQWLQHLTDDDLAVIRKRIVKLGKLHADWFEVADFLGDVTRRIGQCWAGGDYSIVDEHIATGKLQQAIAAVSVSMPTKQAAPTAVLATLTGERHAVGLSLAQLCLRSVGAKTVWVGADTPVAEIVAYLRVADVDIAAFSASNSQTDSRTLDMSYRNIAAVCQKRGIQLITGGRGAWPEDAEYGYRCHSFDDLRGILQALNS